MTVDFSAGLEELTALDELTAFGELVGVGFLVGLGVVCALVVGSGALMFCVVCGLDGEFVVLTTCGLSLDGVTVMYPATGPLNDGFKVT